MYVEKAKEGKKEKGERKDLVIIQWKKSLDTGQRRYCEYNVVNNIIKQMIPDFYDIY